MRNETTCKDLRIPGATQDSRCKLVAQTGGESVVSIRVDVGHQEEALSCVGVVRVEFGAYYTTAILP